MGRLITKKINKFKSFTNSEMPSYFLNTFPRFLKLNALKRHEKRVHEFEMFI